jgi:hypothetical protein
MTAMKCTVSHHISLLFLLILSLLLHVTTLKLYHQVVGLMNELERIWKGAVVVESRH